MDDQEHAELVMLYEQATHDIRTFQERQTRVTHFTTLMYVALVALSPKVMEYGPDWLRSCLPLFVMVAAVAGLGWIGVLQAAIQRARGKVRRAYKQFSQRFRDMSGPERESGWLESWDTLPLFAIVIVVGAIVAVVIMGAILDVRGA
jgi:hypothetical protein